MKDNNNLLNYNQWVSDYDGTANGFVCGGGMKVYPNNKYSYIGESSFKLVKTGQSQVWAEVRKNSNATRFTGNINVYNPYENGALILVITYSDNTQSSTVIYIPPNEDFQNISCSITADAGKTVSMIALRVSLNNGYIDNMSITL